MFDHLLESSRRDDSNKWSNIGLGEQIGIIDIKVAPYLESWPQFHKQSQTQTQAQLNLLNYFSEYKSQR